jgi:hypothetical protein
VNTNNPWGNSTAQTLQKLAALSGLTGRIDIQWNDTAKRYTANGATLGESSGSVTEWIKRQPGWKPHVVK